MLYILISIIATALGGIGAVFYKHYGGTIKKKALASVRRKGEEELIERIKQDPQNPHTYARLAAWYAKNGSVKRARQTIAYAEKLAPDDRKVRKYKKKLSKKV